jgi:glycosyltransferase involved in cell wall biosynthesis
LGFFREFSSKGLGITVKRDPAAFADALKALDKDYEAYSQRVDNFKEKLKWDRIAAQHIAVYRRVIDAKAQLIASTLGSKNMDNRSDK